MTYNYSTDSSITARTITFPISFSSTSDFYWTLNWHTKNESGTASQYIPDDAPRYMSWLSTSNRMQIGMKSSASGLYRATAIGF